MQTFTTIVAIVAVIGVIWGLIKRYETRLVLITGGLVMAFLSFKPMIAFHQFDKSMTNPNLIIAICSAMGFAAVVKLTGCDTHLVSLLTKPLKKLGLFLLPACGLVRCCAPQYGRLLRCCCSDANSDSRACWLQAGDRRGHDHRRRYRDIPVPESWCFS